MKSTCVTAMNKDIWDSIGKYMIDTWIKYWPQDSMLKIYAEDFFPSNINDSRIQIIDWTSTCKNDWEIFNINSKDGRSKRFAKKGFSFSHAMFNNETDYLIWLDADILSYKKFNHDDVLSVLPEGKLIGFFDTFYQVISKYTQEQYTDIEFRSTARNGHNSFAAESGFVVINTKHKLFDAYKNNYRFLFLEKEKSKYLDRWYDGEVCVVAAIEFLDQVQDLSKLRTTDKSQTPLNRSWLVEYFMHMKAKSKNNKSNKEIEKIIKEKENAR